MSMDIDVVEESEDVGSCTRAALSWSPPSAKNTVVAKSTDPTDATEIAKSFRMRSCLPPLFAP